MRNDWSMPTMLMLFVMVFAAQLLGNFTTSMYYMSAFGDFEDATIIYDVTDEVQEMYNTCEAELAEFEGGCPTCPSCAVCECEPTSWVAGIIWPVIGGLVLLFSLWFAHWRSKNSDKREEKIDKMYDQLEKECKAAGTTLCEIRNKVEKKEKAEKEKEEGKK